MITKPTVIITSLGRTGTQFFYTLFREATIDATSVHEPDYLNFSQFRDPCDRIRQVYRQIRESGVSNLVIKKALGRWSLVKLSDARVLGKLSYHEAAQRLRRQREEFITSREGEVYIESSSAYYGLIDVLKDVFAQHRAVYIIRDGRDWVRSKANWGKMYIKGGIRAMVSHTWPRALDMENDPYCAEWDRMSRFERICWAWARLNEHALGTIQENAHSRLFRFEDIFHSKDRYNNLDELIGFVTELPGTESMMRCSTAGWLERRVHESVGHFPPWKEWSGKQKERFKEICGPLMRTLDYDME